MLAERIQQAREDAGLTRYRLAKDVGLSLNQIKNYETGHSIAPVPRIRDIAKRCGKSVSWFLEGTTVPEVEDEIMPNTADLPVWSRRIRQARKLAGMTQQALGEALGDASQTDVSDWERGHNRPKLPMLLRIADVLDTTAESLMGEDEKSAPVDARPPWAVELLDAVRSLRDEIARLNAGALSQTNPPTSHAGERAERRHNLDMGIPSPGGQKPSAECDETA